MTTLEVDTPPQLDRHIRSVRDAAERTVRALRAILTSERDGLQVLRLMKFAEIGHHPIDDRALNVIEQVNQTFTYLVTLEAARWLLEQHPELGGLRINLGASAGFDLESRDPGFLAAEAFAATHPGSNDKLRKDVRRLQEKADGTKHRYVFFSCPKFQFGRQTQWERVAGIEVWSLPVDTLLKAMQ
jgi:hypothetical protein